jgi:RimJ/RimL family protein N-acetyltransferase
MTAPAQARSSVRLRPANAGDAALLFEWLNRPDSLAASLDTAAPVAWQDHERWLTARLADPGTRLWIVERDGAPVGQVRLQDKGDGPEVAIYIDPAARGGGIAGAALDHALGEGALAWPGATAIARVRLDNARSQRLFERAGFVKKARADDHRVLVRSL